jgi:hypothetical protein
VMVCVTQTCKQEYVLAFEGKRVRVNPVVTLCTHFDCPKYLAVQMNCTLVKDEQVQKRGVADVVRILFFFLSFYVTVFVCLFLCVVG